MVAKYFPVKTLEASNEMRHQSLHWQRTRRDYRFLLLCPIRPNVPVAGRCGRNTGCCCNIGNDAWALLQLALSNPISVWVFGVATIISLFLGGLIVLLWIVDTVRLLRERQH